MILHPHTLNDIAVLQTEQIFAGAVNLGDFHICRIQCSQRTLFF